MGEIVDDCHTLIQAELMAAARILALLTKEISEERTLVSKSVRILTTKFLINLLDERISVEENVCIGAIQTVKANIRKNNENEELRRREIFEKKREKGALNVETRHVEM